MTHIERAELFRREYGGHDDAVRALAMQFAEVEAETRLDAKPSRSIEELESYMAEPKASFECCRDEISPCPDCPDRWGEAAQPNILAAEPGGIMAKMMADADAAALKVLIEAENYAFASVVIPMVTAKPCTCGAAACGTRIHSDYCDAA